MDKYIVKLLPRAYRDLENIYAYIAEKLLEPSIARKLIDTLADAIYSLEVLPQRGTPRKSGRYANKGYRSLLAKNFIIVYRIDETDKHVIVVTIRYAASSF